VQRYGAACGHGSFAHVVLLQGGQAIEGTGVAGQFATVQHDVQIPGSFQAALELAQPPAEAPLRQT
jgi:hypothetical protein